MAGKRDLQGRVEGVNDNGVKINGAWYNYSKFFKGERSPDKGAAVSCVIGEFNGKDYLNELTVIGSALPNAGQTSGTQSGGSSPSSWGGRSADTDKRIARQVALKAAVDFTVGGSDEAQVVATARIFEAYLAESYAEANVEDAA
jgi:hypothetical protein